VVSFEIKGDFERTSHFVDLALALYWPTLGGVESIIEQPAALFSLERSSVERRASR
jgi:cystathionine beta-lyase/cystathionine gamma-synthase